MFHELTQTLFSKSDAFTTIIGMQFMTAFVMNVFDPLMMWILPDRHFKQFDVLLPNSDDTDNEYTTIFIAAFLRKVMMLIFVIVVFKML